MSSVMLDVASNVSLPGNLFAGIPVFCVFSGPFDTEILGHLWMYRHLQPVQMVEGSDRRASFIDLHLAEQVLHQHGDYSAVWMIGCIEQPLSLEMVEDILSDTESELLIHRGETALL